ncbi:hypothetical protein STEG23_009513 [Scotinomys teguina]
MDHCVKCPEYQYANTEQNWCINKAVIIMNYEEPVGIALALIVLCFSAFIAQVLGIFVKHHDTPIVKTNNRNLNYFLLISLIFFFPMPVVLHLSSQLSFLHPVENYIWSSIHCIYFHCIGQNSDSADGFHNHSLRKNDDFLVSGATNYIAIYTLIQAIFCAVWLGASPPSVDIDAHSEYGYIFLMCIKVFSH